MQVAPYFRCLNPSDGEMKLHEALSLVHKRVNFWRLHLLTIPPGG